MSDERAWREAYRTGMRRGDSSCADRERLTALVVGDVEPGERLLLADHIAACRTCAEDYRTLRALHHEAGGPKVERRGRWAFKVAGTAAVIAIVGVGLVWLAGPTGEAPHDAVRGESRAASPAGGAVVSGSPSLSWPAQAGASGYQVRLYDEAAEPIWESKRIESTVVRLPDDGEPELMPGAAYFWIVEVEGQVTRRQLGPFWFRMAE